MIENKEGLVRPLRFVASGFVDFEFVDLVLDPSKIPIYTCRFSTFESSFIVISNDGPCQS